MKQLIIEYFRADGSPVTLLDLGSGHMHAQGIPLSNAMRPLRDEVEATRSQRGTLFFNFERERLPLPDTLETRIHINGKEVLLGNAKQTAKGNSFREGTVRIEADGCSFDVIVYLSLSQRWCWLRVRTSGIDFKGDKNKVQKNDSARGLKQLPLHKAAWLRDDEVAQANSPSVSALSKNNDKSQGQTKSYQAERPSWSIDQVESRLADLVHRFEKLEQRVRTIEMIILARDSLK